MDPLKRLIKYKSIAKRRALAKKKAQPVVIPEREAVEKDYKDHVKDFVKYKSNKKGVRVEMPDRVQIVKKGFESGFLEKLSKAKLKLSAVVIPTKSKKPNKKKNKKKKKKDSWTVSWPDGKPKRFDGVTVRQDKDGYYCATHRARSKSYPSPDKIPDSKIKFIESTG